jgi:hypothetical protein
LEFGCAAVTVRFFRDEFADADFFLADNIPVLNRISQRFDTDQSQPPARIFLPQSLDILTRSF